MKKKLKITLIIFLCISIFLNIIFFTTLVYKQNRIDRVLKYLHTTSANDVNNILEDIKKRLVDVDKSKLEDRSYVINTLKDIRYELFLTQLTLGKLKLINSNYDFDISPLYKYISQLYESYKKGEKGLTEIDKKTLKEITDIFLYSEVKGFYKEISVFNIKPNSPKEFYKKPYKRLKNICNKALLELKKHR
ncbi:MAG: hypothetical protein FH753_18445 [Firmicutes bacterium]|nr:hypothetical protein [Bacillota bacterium]